MVQARRICMKLVEILVSTEHEPNTGFFGGLSRIPLNFNS